MAELGIYLAGMFLAFIVAIFTKGNLWLGKHLDHWGREDDDTWIAFCIVIFWWGSLPILFVIGVFRLCYAMFCWMMETSTTKMESVKASAAQAWQKSKEARVKQKEMRKKRIKVVPPAPSVVQGYRAPGPHPCIACGTPTSIDQSHMECVESVDSQYSRLDI